MQKKLIAVAVAGALGIPAVALAQTSTVTISGRAYVEYGHVTQGSSFGGASNRTNIDYLGSPGSNISIQGEEKLGGGLSAWYKCESTADIRGVGQDGFCSRDSAVGLKGAFGNVFVGQWGTPFKRARDYTGANDTGLWGVSGLLTGHSTTTLDGAQPQLFSRRQGNSINYDSPNFSGFQVMASTTSTNSASNRTQSAANDKPRVWSLGGTYRNGPLNLGAAYERHNEFYNNGVTGAAGFVSTAGVATAGTSATVATTSGDEAGWLFSAAYTFAGKVRVGGMYTRQKWEPTPTTEGKVRAWHLGVDWKLAGPHSIRAAYTRALDVKGNAAAVSGGLRPAAGPDTSAYMVQARYVYAFSKRTEMTVGFNRVKNDNAAAYPINGIGNNGGGAYPGVGSKNTAIGMSIDHRF